MSAVRKLDHGMGTELPSSVATLCWIADGLWSNEEQLGPGSATCGLKISHGAGGSNEQSHLHRHGCNQCRSFAQNSRASDCMADTHVSDQMLHQVRWDLDDPSSTCHGDKASVLEHVIEVSVGSADHAAALATSAFASGPQHTESLRQRTMHLPQRRQAPRESAARRQCALRLPDSAVATVHRSSYHDCWA